MTEEPQRHWDRVYSDKAPGEVSWFQSEPRPSLAALVRFDVPHTAPFVDIGGGASNPVDALLAGGWRDVTVVDIAAPALAAAQARLGEAAAGVHWEIADITRWNPPRRYGVWHDRAVFHFSQSRSSGTPIAVRWWPEPRPMRSSSSPPLRLMGQKNAAACRCSATMRQALPLHSGVRSHCWATGARNTSPRGAPRRNSAGARSGERHSPSRKALCRDADCGSFASVVLCSRCARKRHRGSHQNQRRTIPQRSPCGERQQFEAGGEDPFLRQAGVFDHRHRRIAS